MDKIKNLKSLDQRREYNLKQVRENAKNEILRSLHDGTFFELYVHKTMSNDFLHIVHFVPDEFFLDKQCVYLLKEKAREFFISQVDNCENAQEFLRIIKERDEFASSLRMRICHAQNMQSGHIKIVESNLETLKKIEKNKTSTYFNMQKPLEK